MHRISVVGCPGSGKTTFARAIAQVISAPHLELDSVYHQADWTPLPDAQFVARVTEFAAAERWVVDGNYTRSGVQDVLWERADTVVWLDLPRPQVMWHVTTRSLSRVLRGTELWNGNRERLRNLVATDPNENIVRWAWTQYDRIGAKFADKLRDPRWVGLNYLRVRTRAQQRALLHELARHSSHPV